MTTNEIFTTKLKLAAILYAHNIPRRRSDPITRESVPTRTGKDQDIFTFWFDVIKPEEKIRADAIIKRFNELETQTVTTQIVIDDENSVDQEWAALTCREIMMGEMFGRAHPMVRKEVGNVVMVVGKGMSPEKKKKMEQQFREMLK